MGSKDSFTALVVSQRDGGYEAALKEVGRDQLPEGDVLVRVSHSTLNYKDGMIVTGVMGRRVGPYPLVPGIDLAGTVEESSSPEYRPGDQVVVTGWGVGETHWGGYGQYARVKSDWIVPLPTELSLRDAMAIGTAGVAAMLGVLALEEHGIAPGSGEVLVTGAAGGVGSIAVAVLGKLGYQVVASTGRADLADYLHGLGAHRIIPRAEIEAVPDRPLMRQNFAGAIDNVGGTTLAHILACLNHNGSVAAVGLAGGAELKTTVMPFLLRGVNLLGVDSGFCARERRLEVWRRLVADLPRAKLQEMIIEAPLAEVPRLAVDILKGQVRGRLVVDLDG